MKGVNEYIFSKDLVPGDHPVVIKAMSKNTGHFVAIKYFSNKVLSTIGQDQIFRNINIFSTLRHKNIASIHEVIYNKDGAFIATDWCEGASLKNAIDKFGSLQEKLAARYTVEMLRGLQFLHKQGRPHTNLKASNLLLSSGTLRLSDFGLAAEISNQNLRERPYWHAPEVLDTKNFNKASDIWSLGCTIIELLSGKPPFAEFSPEEARIKLQTETPTIPVKASAHLRDFLTACFSKSPEERPTVDDCFNFFFVKNALKLIEESEPQLGLQSGLTPVSLKLNPANPKISNDGKVDGVKIATNKSGPKPPENLDFMSDEDEEKPLQTPQPKQMPSNLTDLDNDTGLMIKPAQVRKPDFGLDADEEAIVSSGSKGLPPSLIPSSGLRPPSLLSLESDSDDQKQQKLALAPSPAKPRMAGPAALDALDLDDDSSDAPLQMLPKPSPLQLAPSNQVNKKPDFSAFDESDSSSKPLQITNKPSPSPLQLAPSNQVNKKPDFSAFDESDSSSKPLQITNKPSPLPLQLNPSPKPATLQLAPSPSTPKKAGPEAIDELFSDDDDAPLQLQPKANNNKPPSQLKPLGSNNENIKNPLILNDTPTKGSLKDFIEDDDSERPIIAHKPHVSFGQTEYSNVVGSIPPSSSGKGINSNLSIFMEDEQEDVDIQDDGGQAGEAPLQLTLKKPEKLAVPANIDFEDDDEEIFEYRTKLENMKQEMIAKMLALSPTMSDKQLKESFTTILDIIKKEPSVRACIIPQQGIMPIIEIIELGSLTPESAQLVLSIIYEIVVDYLPIKENFCLLGGIPPVMKFLDSKEWPHGVRSMSMNIMSEIIKDSSDNMQMFIACNGISALVETIQYDITEETSLVFSTIKSIKNVINTRCGIQVADFCRLFMNAGLIGPLSETLIKIVDTPTIRDDDILADICYIIRTFSQADTKVKLAMSDAYVMSNIVHALYYNDEVRTELSSNCILDLCKSINLIATISDTRDNLTEAGVMEATCAMLKKDFDKDATIKIHSNLIQVLAFMCKLSKERLAIVAQSGLIESLRPYLEGETDLKALVMYVLIQFPKVAFSNKNAMHKLIDDGLIDIYIGALDQQVWGAGAMTAIAMLASEESFGVFKIIDTPTNLEKVRHGIERITGDNAPTMMQRLNEICKLNKTFTQHLSDDKFAQLITDKLKMSLKLPADSQFPVALLDLILTIVSSGKPNVRFSAPEFTQNVQTFALNGNFKQKNIATRIINHKE